MIVSFVRPLIDSQSRVPIKTSACLRAPFSSNADLLGLFAVDLRQLGRLAMSPQQFIELGLNCLSVPMLCPLDDHSQVKVLRLPISGSARVGKRSDPADLVCELAPP